MHKKFGSHNSFLTQSMHLSENTKSNRSLWRNKERVLLANPPPELKETTSWTMVGQVKDIIASSPHPLVPLYAEAVMESEARPAVVQLKSEV